MKAQSVLPAGKDQEGIASVARVTRKMQNASCPDDENPNALPIVSGKDTVAGKATVITAAIIDGDRVFFDEAATHGRTGIEQEVEWLDHLDDVPNGRRIFVVWLFIKPDRQTRDYVYHGAVAVDMYIDDEAKKGYKRLGHHAQQLGRALQGDINLDILDESARRLLTDALNQYPDTLQHSKDELKVALGIA